MPGYYCMTQLFARRVGDRIALTYLDPATPLVRLAASNDDRACKCCADECDVELSLSVSFCGMTVTGTLPVPGVLNQSQATLPDGSYLILSAIIGCEPCGWSVLIGVCAYCDATGQAASDAFTGLIPFAGTPVSGNTYCPDAGVIELECFSDQFGLPCLTSPTASIA